MSVIQVYRNAGDIVGAAIVEPLLSASVLIDRGRFEMDAHAHPKSTVDIGIPYRDGLRLGQLVSVSDPVGTTDYRAKIKGIAIHLENGAATQTLSLERTL